jgi:hypothetical protein
MKFTLNPSGAEPMAQGIANAIKTAALAPIAREQAEQAATLQNARVYAANMAGNKAGAEAENSRYTLAQRQGVEDLISKNPQFASNLQTAIRLFGLTGDDNIERLARASGEIQTQGIRDQAVAAVDNVDRMNRLNTLAKPGDTYMPYDNVGNTGVSLNKATGSQVSANPVLAKIYQAVQGSMVNENNAQAGAAGASAALSNERRRAIQQGDVRDGSDADGNPIAYRVGTAGKVEVLDGVAPRARSSGADAAATKARARIAEQVAKDPMIAPEDQEAEVERRMRLATGPSVRDYMAAAKNPSGGKGGSNMDSDMPAGIPAGSKQIGTAKGKPVWQAPNGKRYIVE